MDNLKIYCMCLSDTNLSLIKSLNYIPVGLKNENFSSEWVRDNSGVHISSKNPYYGEYTFYYWYWKNLLSKKNKKDWIGFCSYREYWASKSEVKSNNLKDLVLQNAYPEWDDYDAIIGKPISINKVKPIKMLKYGKLSLIRNPKAIFESGRTIRWQFDMYHGNGNLDKAIELLPNKDRNDFRDFTRNETSYSRGNIFISKSSSIINNYFEDIFNWLIKCEEVFGFNLKGYGQIRMYTFLAERFLPYWFKKYTKFLEWPVIFYDINKLK